MMNTEMRVSFELSEREHRSELSHSTRTRSQLSVFFCDTYALIEIIKGNKSYESYTYHILITSDLNLIELYYSLLRDYGRNLADKYFEEWEKSSIRIPTFLIPQAMELRLTHRKENLSYIDCMGYVYALENDMLFLTGDSKFKNKVGVEFIK